MKENNQSLNNGRLLSLDILRGFDLFMLVFLQPVLLKILAHFGDNDVAKYIMFQLDHEVWSGFRAWDLVMPLFLFMTGVAMPFSFAKYAKEGERTAFVRRMLRRVVVLWLLGMVVQGNLLSFNMEYFRYFSNTLQSIAIGYLIAGIALLTLKMRGQIALAAGLLVVYSVPMFTSGDFTAEGNFAAKIDQMILGSHRDDPSYTWIWSSLTFGVTVMLGAFAGQIVRIKNAKKETIAKILFLIGLALTVSGLLLSGLMPIIKRLWTTSMTLYSGGLCFLLLALFYYVIDCKGYSKAVLWLRYYGMNSIAAYMLGEWLNFRDVANQFLYGLQPIVGDYYDVVLTLGNVLIIFLILRAMFRSNWFLKV